MGLQALYTVERLSPVQDRAKVIMQFFTSIELYTHSVTFVHFQSKKKKKEKKTFFCLYVLAKVFFFLSLFAIVCTNIIYRPSTSFNNYQIKLRAIKKPLIPPAGVNTCVIQQSFQPSTCTFIGFEAYSA